MTDQTTDLTSLRWTRRRQHYYERRPVPEDRGLAKTPSSRSRRNSISLLICQTWQRNWKLEDKQTRN